MSLLLFIFINSCGLVHIEIRDRAPAQKTHKTTTKPQAQRPESSPPPVQRKDESLRFPSPVKGKATRTERGYHIATACDDFFRSVGEGKVLYAGDDIKGYGWVVMVQGEEGFVFVYGKAGHLMVKRGEKVKKGQVLGKVGNLSEGCGILFEVRDMEGRPVSFELVL